MCRPDGSVAQVNMSSLNIEEIEILKNKAEFDIRQKELEEKE